MKLSTKIGCAAFGAASLVAAGLYLFRLPATVNEPVHTSAPIESVAHTAPPTFEKPRELTPSSDRSIVVENGMLTLVLRGQLVGPVLAEISKKSRVNIYSLPAIDARSVTIELRGVPLERGIQELMKDCDIFLYSTAGMLRSLWIYEKDAGAELMPVPPESWASTADVERQLNAGSPAERISAIETLVARNGPNSGEVVNRALLDDNADVRLRALDVALSAGVSVPRETLTSLTADSSAPVRALALEAIANGTEIGGPGESEIEQLVGRMMNDPDTDVRTKASEILESRRTTD